MTGPWLNVLDPTFNLHLREDRIAAAWVVRKPSVNGDIHSLELYDARAHNFCRISASASPDRPSVKTGAPSSSGSAELALTALAAADLTAGRLSPMSRANSRER